MKRPGLLCSLATLFILAVAVPSQAYVVWGDVPTMRSDGWQLGDVTVVKYALDTAHGTADLPGDAEWSAIQSMIAQVNNLAYRVNYHNRAYMPDFPGGGATHDMTEVRRFPMFKFQQVAPGSGESVLFAGWTSSDAATIASTSTSRVISFSNAFTWTSVASGSTGTSIDVGTVAIHELLHTLGLDHTNPLHPECVMWQGYNFQADRSLEVDDLNGLSYLYGPKVGTDYAAVCDTWAKAEDGNDYYLALHDRSTFDAADSYISLSQGTLPQLRTPYLPSRRAPINPDSISWDLSWSLPSYGPQDGGTDGTIPGADVAMAQDAFFGTSYNAANVTPLVPEPATVCLLALGTLLAIRRGA